MKVKRKDAAVAGLFYSEDREALEEEVQELLDAGGTAGVRAADPAALIVPHAGYRYSGPVAARGFRTLRSAKKPLAIIGPAHRMAVSGIATSSADFFVTPLGEVRVDDDARSRALSHSCVKVVDTAFEKEHCIEVQLPFLQTLLPDFTFVPLLVGLADDDCVEVVLEDVLGQGGLAVVTSDLSHYFSYEQAKRMDTETIRAMERLAPDDISNNQACGASAVRGLLGLARKRRLRPQFIDAANSGDTEGNMDNVVGYCSMAFYA